MKTNNNSYNQAPPQPQMQMPRRAMNGQWRKGGRNIIPGIQNILPNWVTRYAIVIYLMALFIVGFMYSSHSMPWYYWLSGIISVLVFFLYGQYSMQQLSELHVRKSSKFEKKVFILAIVPRVIWMFLIYSIFMQNYGDAFGFENMDARYYDDLGRFIHTMIENGNFHFYDEIPKWNGGHDDISDMGYGIYVGFVYWLAGGSIIIVRLLKCLWSSLTVLLIYRLTKRNFGDKTARIAAVFCALWPNFWYYCGVHLKETEMVFLAVLFVEQADQMLRSKQFTAWKVIPVLLIGATIFTFRMPLALVAFLALIFSVVMSSSRVVSWGKRVIVGGLVILLVVVTMGNRIQEQTYELMGSVQSGRQKDNMEWRSERTDGGGIKQSFAKYAGAAVFAPMIFTIPFPSFVRPFDGQDVVQIMNGGNFVKNIISGFIILAMITLLLSGKWREHLLPMSFFIGYLLVLSMSEFAHSERFHQPVMPFAMLFAAYGLNVAVTKPKYKRWFTYWCVLIFVACIAWNWFKMAGRGLS